MRMWISIFLIFILKGKFWTTWKSIYHNFGSIVDSPPTIYRSDPWPNVLSHILIEIQSFLTLYLIRLSSTEHIWSILEEIMRHTVKEVIWKHNFDQYYDLLWVKHVESCVSTWGNWIRGWPVRFIYVYRIILWLTG